MTSGELIPEMTENGPIKVITPKGNEMIVRYAHPLLNGRIRLSDGSGQSFTVSPTTPVEVIE